MVAVAVLCALAVPLRSDEPISAAVTYNREIVRIFDRKCLPCHTPGAIAMSLDTYREARLWARGIREELVERRMPPWRAAAGYGAFANDIGLTPRELTMILTWADGGTPRGDDRDLPRRAEPRHLGTHERRSPGTSEPRNLELPPQRVPAGEEHVIRRVTIDPGAAAGRSIRQIQIVPGETRVLRAAFVSIVSADRSAPHWIGAWTPWLRAVSAPDGVAFPLDADARLAIELHYRGRDTDLEDRSSIALFYAPAGTPVANQILVETAPAPGTERIRRGESRLRQETRVWAIFPEAASRGEGSLEVTARKPDGSIDVMLWIPNRHDEWPTPYVLQTPVLLPAGTTIKVTTTATGRIALSTSPSSSVASRAASGPLGRG